MTDWSAADAIDCADERVLQTLLDRVETREKGHYFEFFEPGDEIHHDPGLVLSRHGNEEWMGQTLNHDPAYWRPDEAEARGFEEPPAHPDYLLACVMGASVEDCSEKGGYFLGRDDVQFHHHGVAPRTELRVESTVRDTRMSSSRPEYGIVTWKTAGIEADTGETLVTYERTNMIPRRDPAATDSGQSEPGESGDTATTPALPETFVTPEGGAFEDFRRALDEAEASDAAVAYRHERGRTMDDLTVAALPLATLNTARQHHNAAAMADSPSGEPVAYGDVTRSTALGHARSDERTWREVGAGDERFHDFVTAGDTVFGFTVVLDCAPVDGEADAGEVRFRHVAHTQDRRPVYSGTRTALIERRDR